MSTIHSILWSNCKKSINQYLYDSFFNILMNPIGLSSYTYGKTIQSLHSYYFNWHTCNKFKYHFIFFLSLEILVQFDSKPSNFIYGCISFTLFCRSLIRYIWFLTIDKLCHFLVYIVNAYLFVLIVYLYECYCFV